MFPPHTTHTHTENNYVEVMELLTNPTVEIISPYILYQIIMLYSLNLYNVIQ